MINFIIDRKSINKIKDIYTIYYLTRNYNDKVIINSEAKENCINIFYGVKPTINNCIYIPMKNNDNRNIFYNKYNDDIYVSFGEKIESPYNVNSDKLYFNFDIVSISAYLITVSEEYEIKTRDDLNRFLAENSYRKDSIAVPYFDINSKILMDAIKFYKADLGYKDNNFRILLTHDVDSINSRNKYVFLHNLKEILVNKNKAFSEKIKRLFLDVISNRHIQIDNYIQIESESKAKSEFYFIAGEKCRLGKRYDLQSIPKKISRLRENPNYVIGIHTNFYSYNDKNKIKNEIKEIENKCNVKVRSCRNHYLRFKVPNTWMDLSDCGIKFDCTLGYSDKNGFRAGTCREFIPFNCENDNIIDILEIPLVVMDGIIMEKDISFDEKWNRIKLIIDYIKKFNGVSSILWHQRVIYDKNYKDMYIKILKYVNSIGGIFVNTNDLFNEYVNQKKELNDLINEFIE